MKDILKELWNGELAPWDEKWERENEARELGGLLERHKGALEKELGANGKEILEKYKDCYDELQSIGREEAFINGLSLGVRIVAEAFGKNKRQTKPLCHPKGDKAAVFNF